MLIANPIYDAVFKYLMEDAEIARGFLSVLLEEEIIELQMPSQESVSAKTEELPMVLRLDFLATIKTATGENKKVLIELQKARHYEDVMRFRRYLGQQYGKVDEVIKVGERDVENCFPIITVYFIGFKLKNIQTPVVRVNRVYTDVISHQTLEKVKEDFIELLTHDTYVIQIPRLNQNIQTKIEELLSIFNQSFGVGNKHQLSYPYEPKDPLHQKIVRRLVYATSSEEVQASMNAYDDFDFALNRHFRKQELEMEENDRIISEKDKVLEEKEREIERLLKLLEGRL